MLPKGTRLVVGEEAATVEVTRDMEPDAELLEKVGATLAVHSVLYLGTSADHAPWVAAAYFAEADALTLRVILEGEGGSLRNLRANPHFGVVISSGSPFELFLQADGDAVASGDAAELAGAKRALVAKVPQAAGFLQAPVPMAAVELRVREWRATDVMKGWIPARRLEAPSREVLA